jgi:hypothetical protein
MKAITGNLLDPPYFLSELEQSLARITFEMLASEE